jgi:ribosomal protein S18 acetylase RimI-like enzyme
VPLAEVYRFRRALNHDQEESRWPAGVSIVPFEPSRHALLIHRLLEEGYRNGGGRVAGFASWWSALSADAEYDPSLIFPVGDRSCAPVAVALCWTSAYVKDLVVARAARRQGLATNLLRHVFQVFRARGADAVDLKVDVGNRSAISLYRSLGMTCAETLWVEH